MMQLSCKGIWVFLVAVSVCRAQSSSVPVSGTVLDSMEASISGARVHLRHALSGMEAETSTDSAGAFQFAGLAKGEWTATVTAGGFGAARARWRVDGAQGPFRVVLNPADVVQEIKVTAGQIVGLPEQLERIPGSIGIVSATTLQESHVLTTDEALRKVSGVHTRAEEGFSLRPNIGIRGLNPTRSSRVLLLEDGLPLSYAPYGDNASYYHPPVDRFESIEVVKGSGQIVYGPMTVGGVVNYVTPPAPDKRGGSLTLTGGNRDYFNGHLKYGGTLHGTGVNFDVMRKQGDGSRENTHHGLTDFNAKSLTALGQKQTLGLRFNYYAEDSNLTYTGAREDEFLLNPRGNPFRNDFFYIDRYGSAVTHSWAAAPNVVISTNAYANVFLRDWWRQSSNSAQRPNDSTDPACRGMANLHTTCGNEGRLRHFVTWGVEPKARARHTLFGVRSETDLGVRYHDEFQERYQKNGPLPTSRDGVTVENNERIARAASTFLQNRFFIGRLTITPGIRMESVRFRRTNFLNGVRGNTDLRQWIPGIGAAYSTGANLTIFAGVHRGFAPPRVEDIISNNTGQSIELDPELSWNYELGARTRPHRDVELEGAFFRMDFSNQIVPASVAGGVGAALTNAGRTLHQGWEVSGRWTKRSVASSRHSAGLRGAYTWLTNASYESLRFSAIPGFTGVPIRGNRLPYSPRHLLTGSVNYWHAGGFNALVEGVYTGSQFGDDLNTVGATPDGQRGLIPANTVWNITANYPVEAWRTNFFITTKNALDRLTIVDRSRGVLPGMPRLVQFGLRVTF
ncbi:MAG: TonB-dependent receptor [Bryobacterales bacterium]|nr:TonB-dependent receptor [Bryobacterales bacterium]